MFNLDDITNKHNEEHNLEGPYVPDHPYRMLIIGGFGSGKTNAFLNLIKKNKIKTILLNRLIYMLKT